MKAEIIIYLIDEIQHKLSELKSEVLKNKDFENQTNRSDISTIVTMCNEIINNSSNQKQASLFEGIKSFAQVNGYLSDKQMAALELTHKTVNKNS